MPISEAFSGTATIGATEFSLPNNSTTLTPRTEDGVYQLLLDLSAVDILDSFQLNILEKVIDGGAQVIIYKASLPGPAPAFVIPSVILLYGWDMTIRKISGTDRSISWSIRRVA